MIYTTIRRAPICSDVSRGLGKYCKCCIANIANARLIMPQSELRMRYLGNYIGNGMNRIITEETEHRPKTKNLFNNCFISIENSEIFNHTYNKTENKMTSIHSDSINEIFEIFDPKCNI